MMDYIDEIIKTVCDSVVVSAKHTDFDIDDYESVRELVEEIVESL